MRTLRNVFRRKLRAFLTIFGITIGVLALVVMGAMAEKMQLLVDGGSDYFSDKVQVMGPAGFAGMGAEPLSMDLVDDVEAIDGVAVASAEIGLMLDEEPSSVNMGIPPSISADDFAGEDLERLEIVAAQGRLLEPGDTGVVVVGSDLVANLDAVVGEDVEIRGKTFEVIGIMEKTLTGPDMTVVMSMDDAREILLESLPTQVRETIDQDTIISGVTVYPEDGVDPDKLATTIEEEIAGVSTMGPDGFRTSIEEPLKIFNQIIYAIAFISLLVGGLSVINTMTMSVSERTREIGIRKSIGATKSAVMRQFMSESALIGLMGGVVGLVIGAGIVAMANAAGADSATRLFQLTPRLAVGSVGFALVLGVLSGLYPAWHAASLDPVKALRYE